MLANPKVRKFLIEMEKTAFLIGAILVFIFFSMCFYWYKFDREEPFEVYSYVSTPAKQGGKFHVVAKVRRDLDRECSVDYSRFMYDINGVRFYESPPTHMSSDALTAMNQQMKGDLILDIPVPENASVGPVVIQTALSYRCNPMHIFKPIEMVMVVETLVTE